MQLSPILSQFSPLKSITICSHNIRFQKTFLPNFDYEQAWLWFRKYWIRTLVKEQKYPNSRFQGLL